MLIDLHTHTHPSSWDSFLSPDELVERSKQAGLDAIVLSEHDWAWDPEEVRRLAKRHDFPVLAGMEINTEDGHLLVYGVHEYIYGMHRSHELAGHVERRDGVMVAAHPYRRQHPWNWESAKEWSDALDRAQRNAAYRFIVGMEVINGRGKVNENDFADHIARLMGFPGTGGTDSHATTDIGKCATYFERDIHTEAELIEELRAGRFWPVDLTGGALSKNPGFLNVPSNIEAAWAEIAERRREYLEAFLTR
jgi:predicted metal-dependent phosphoesterase TrpH